MSAGASRSGPSFPAPTSSAPSSASTTPAPGGSAGAACPTSYRPPASDRPVVALTFDIAADHATVTGTEKVKFTPDADITELVFRLTANTAPTFALGTSIRVTSATTDHGSAPARYERDGAAPASQGGLLRIPLAGPVKAGVPVTAEVAFTLTLGRAAFDRFGRSGQYAWFGSAQPLLAWERGYGWHTEPMLQFTAESASSEAADTDLTVTAPAGDTVLASGLAAVPESTQSGRRTWHSTIAAARDVSVAAGPFVLRDADIGGVQVRVGAPTFAQADEVLADERIAFAGLTSRFGKFPFPNLSAALLPVPGGGIEYPSSILYFGSSRLVTVHETAHQWFYALVGDSQAEHAWLDEAFASYAEQLVDDDPPPAADLNLPGPVDRPTADYGTDSDRYYRITYDKGAAALHAARSAAGPAGFDAAMRCYVNANAWRVAEPGDFASAFSQLPAALAVLRRAGALS